MAKKLSLILLTWLIALMPAIAGGAGYSSGGGAPNVSTATGTLPVANGGTGVTTASVAPYPMFTLHDGKNGDGSVLATTAAAGNFAIVQGTLGSGALSLDSEAAASNTKTDTVVLYLKVPEYLQSVTSANISIVCEHEGGGTVSVATIDVELYQLAYNETPSADLISGTIQNVPATPGEITFALGSMPTPSRTLKLIIRGVITETGGVATRIKIYRVYSAMLGNRF